MKKPYLLITIILIICVLAAGCSKKTSSTKNQEESQEESQETVTEIVLSEQGITVDGQDISLDTSKAVYTGRDIVYYEEGQDETYGEGSSEDAHSAKEAGENTVITIAQPGTYKVSGTLSCGQIAVDLGEDAKDDSEAVVNLILDNADITCTVAPAIVVYNVYECGSEDEEDASPSVDTQAAGFRLILAADSKNVINGSYVAKIYQDNTTQEDVENGNAKKKYKFDAAIDSLMSFEINAYDNGALTVNAENEGISSGLHLTINSGAITINSADDAINTNEDNVSVLTINDGTIICNSGLGEEGDGIDSNGYIVINGGYVIASANASSQDSGVDSDQGIYLNGGTILATGNMYDEVSQESNQQFMVLSFLQKISPDEMIMLTDENDQAITAFSAVNAYSIAVLSSSDLTEGNYHLYRVSSVTGDCHGGIYSNITKYSDAVQLQYRTGGMGMGGFGMGDPAAGERPQMPDGEAPERQDGERPQLPDGEAPERQDGEMPQMPDGEAPEWQDGERPQMPDGEAPERQDGEQKQISTEEAMDIFALSKDNFQFSQITEKQ